MNEFDHDAYVAHLLNGGTPFGEPFNATIREMIDAMYALVGMVNSLPPAQSHPPTPSPDEATDESAGFICPTNCDCPLEFCKLNDTSVWGAAKP